MNRSSEITKRTWLYLLRAGERLPLRAVYAAMDYDADNMRSLLRVMVRSGHVRIGKSEGKCNSYFVTTACKVPANTSIAELLDAMNNPLQDEKECVK